MLSPFWQCIVPATEFLYLIFSEKADRKATYACIVLDLFFFSTLCFGSLLSSVRYPQPFHTLCIFLFSQIFVRVQNLHAHRGNKCSGSGLISRREQRSIRTLRGKWRRSTREKKKSVRVRYRDAVAITMKKSWINLQRRETNKRILNVVSLLSHNVWFVFYYYNLIFHFLLFHVDLGLSSCIFIWLMCIHNA